PAASPRGPGHGAGRARSRIGAGVPRRPAGRRPRRERESALGQVAGVVVAGAPGRAGLRERGGPCAVRRLLPPSRHDQRLPVEGRLRLQPVTGRNGPAGPTPDLLSLRSAVRIRREWLRHALCTDPADRAATEQALSELYALIGADPPRFVWVDSPCAA